MGHEEMKTRRAPCPDGLEIKNEERNSGDRRWLTRQGNIERKSVRISQKEMWTTISSIWDMKEAQLFVILEEIIIPG